MIRDSRTPIAGAVALTTLLAVTTSLHAQADEPRSGQALGHWLHRHHEKAPACVECNPVAGTSKTATTRYESRENVICYPKAVCHCFRCRLHLHGHHADCDPVIVPVVKRVLVKHQSTDEQPTTNYEGKITPRPPVVEPVEPHCRLHGLGCLGGH